MARRWSKPPEGIAKLNVDASFIAATGAGAAGCVCRDDQGTVIFSAGISIPPCSDAEEAECHALLSATELTFQLHKGPV